MKNKAFTIRFNDEVEADRNLLDMLEEDSKRFRSTSDCIKSRLIENYNSSKDDSFEEMIKQSQKELIEQIYDICLKIISAVGGINVNATADVDVKEPALPESTDLFPDELTDILDDILAT